LKRVRAEGLENTLAHGHILLAGGIKDVDIPHDTSPTVEKAKSGNAEKTCATDVWVMSYKAERITKRDRWCPHFFGGWADRQIRRYQSKFAEAV
jgi:hypothetical protein